MNRLAIFSLFILFHLFVGAQTRKVKGEYVYYSDPNMSHKEAMAAAVENARVQALAKEFGTLITQITQQEEGQNGNKEHNFFMQLNAAEVKGEWIEDTKKPNVKIIETTSEGVLVIR